MITNKNNYRKFDFAGSRKEEITIVSGVLRSLGRHEAPRLKCDAPPVQETNPTHEITGTCRGLCIATGHVNGSSSEQINLISYLYLLNFIGFR